MLKIRREQFEAFQPVAEAAFIRRVAEHLRDNPLNPDWREGQSPARRLVRLYSLDQEETHAAIAEMRAALAA